MATLYYIHDPMCSWCWAFRPVWSQIQAQLPEAETVKYLLGGLAPDSNMPMTLSMQAEIQAHWETIQKKVPGTLFNFHFWTCCKPRRSTYPACRAVIATRKQKPSLEDEMIRLIQETYYLDARNPSDDDTLIDLAQALDMDTDLFRIDLNAPETQNMLLAEIRSCQGMGVRCFPGLVLESNGDYQQIHIDYNDADKILQQILAFPIQKLKP